VYVCVCLCVSVYPLIVSGQRLCNNPLIVDRQRLGKNALIVARQRLGKNTPIVARQRLSRNVTVVTNTQATIEELLEASFSMWPLSYEEKKAIISSQNFLSQCSGQYSFSLVLKFLNISPNSLT
jgi:hypothetical protein